MPKRMNIVIKFLITSDFFLSSAWGFIAPIFAIFILKDIVAGDVVKGAQVAGFAALIYWVTKSFLQIPISQYLDRTHGEKDDYWFMVGGLFLASLAPFGFLISSLPWHIYALQALYALGMALFVPSWNAIFTRHMDRERVAFEWSMDSTCMGLGAGITAGLGGIIAATFGFETVLILVGGLTMISSFLLLFVHKHILPRDHIFPRFFPFKKSKHS